MFYIVLLQHIWGILHGISILNGDCRETLFIESVLYRGLTVHNFFSIFSFSVLGCVSARSEKMTDGYVYVMKVLGFFLKVFFLRDVLLKLAFYSYTQSLFQPDKNVSKIIWFGGC